MRLPNARLLDRMTAIASLGLVAVLALAVLLVAQVRPAGADEVAYGRLKIKGPTSGSNTVVMGWQGEIAAPMAAQISEAFEARKAGATRFLLLLDSGGGSVAEGERVIEVLRRIKRTHELMTAVAHGQKCGSMCVFIFVQGQERIGALTSAWLFHEVSRLDPNTQPDHHPQSPALGGADRQVLCPRRHLPDLDRRHEAVHIRVGLLADRRRPYAIELQHHHQDDGQPAAAPPRPPGRRSHRVVSARLRAALTPRGCPGVRPPANAFSPCCNDQPGGLTPSGTPATSFA